MVAIVFCIARANDLPSTESMPFVATVVIVTSIKSTATYYPGIGRHWYRKQRCILWDLMQKLHIDNGNRTTYIDWLKIRWLEAPFGKVYIGSAYFYRLDLVSMSNQPKSLMAQCPLHIPDCNDYYIRSI